MKKYFDTLSPEAIAALSDKHKVELIMRQYCNAKHGKTGYCPESIHTQEAEFVYKKLKELGVGDGNLS